MMDEMDAPQSSLEPTTANSMRSESHNTSTDHRHRT